MPFKTRQQIADEFGINVRTLYRWLLKWDYKLPGGLIRPVDQEQIYQKLGRPGSLVEDLPGDETNTRPSTRKKEPQKGR